MITAAPPLASGVTNTFLLLEKLYAIVALIVLSGAMLPLIVGYADASEKDYKNPVLIQLILSAIYAVAAALLLRMKVLTSAPLSVPMPLILLLGYATISSAWSIDPELTLKRVIPLLGMTLVGIFLATRFTLEGFLKLAFVACFVMTAASLLAGFALPQYGIQPGEASWAGLRGVFANKNTMGSIAAFAMLVSIYHIATVTRRDLGRVWIGGVGLALAVFCLILSLSASSLIAASAALVAIVVLRVLQRSSNAVVPATMCIVPILLAGIAASQDNLRALFQAFGRDATLTGRIDLWNFASQLIADRPWLGHGYGVTWEKLAWLFRVPHVHNGFLQVALDLGFFGLALCLLLLAQVARRCLSLVWRSSSFSSTFSTPLLLVFLINNIAEVSLLAGHSLQWCLLVFVAVQTSLDLDRQRSSGQKRRDPPERQHIEEH